MREDTENRGETEFLVIEFSSQSAEKQDFLSPEAQTNLPLTSSWPEFSHMGSLRYKQSWGNLSTWQALICIAKIWSSICKGRSRVDTQETPVVFATQSEPGKKNLYRCWLWTFGPVQMASACKPSSIYLGVILEAGEISRERLQSWPNLRPIV